MSLKSVLQNSFSGETFSKDAKNKVRVENSHLYPDLLRMAFRKIGYRGKNLEAKIQKTVKHETEHSIPLLNLPHVQVRFGVSFYKLKTFPFTAVVQPFLGYRGKPTLKEMVDAYTNVEYPSPEDKSELQDMLKRSQKPSQEYQS